MALINSLTSRYIMLKIFLLVTFLIQSLYASNDLSKLLDSEQRLIKLYQQTVPSVVNVSNVKEFKDFFFGSGKAEVGAGTGFIWDDQGHIITNYHVVQDKRSQFMISFHNTKTQVQAKIVGVEPKLDIAVLKVDTLPSNTKPISIGSSQDLKVGQIAVAIGNPFGLDHTMTSGIVSALGRKIDGIGGVKINNMIQTNADINPGNSGGPLLNSSGEVVGMNTMIYSNSGTSAGLGFAVPIDSIKSVVPDLIKHGKVIRPAIGIVPLAEQYHNHFLPGEKGVVIAYVPEGSAADSVGLIGMRRDRMGRLHMGDIIKKVDGKKIDNLDDLFELLDKYKVGDKIKIEVKRDDGAAKTIDLVLQSS